MKILLRGFQNSSSIKCIQLDDFQIKTFEQLSDYLSTTTPESNSSLEFSFSSNGVNKRQEEFIPSLSKAIYDVKSVDRGGKGGFGSLLKGQPPVKKRTNNFDSCRDLSGRRMRHLTQEKLLREWQAKKMEEEKIIKMYNNPDENKKVEDYVDSDKKRELIDLNRKYIKDSCNSTDLIVKSVKYVLKKKRNREDGKNEEVEKAQENDRQGNFNNIINENKIKRRLLIDDLNIDECEVDEKGKQDMEKKLFSLDF